MLTIFPSLLSYGFFAPTLVRVAAALIFLFVAYDHYTRKDSLAHTNFPIIGRGMWVVWLTVVAEGLAGAGLLLGYYTQAAAILGALLALKQFVWGNAYPHFFILPRATTVLLLAICLSLVVSGAGALAFDIHL